MIEEALVSQDLLQEWASYSLKERAQLIYKKFKIKASCACLRDLYRRNKIGFRKVVTVKQRAMERKTLLDE